MSEQKYTPLQIVIDRDQMVCTVVHLSGAAGIDEADRLSRELRQVASETHGRLVLNLTDLEFICSMGLGALIVAHIAGQKRDCEVRLAGPQPAVREVLQTTRLDRIFPLYDDLNSAVQ